MSKRFAVCPTCGALGVAGGQCDYCGTPIVIKENTATYEARVVSRRTIPPAEFAKKISIFSHVGEFSLGRSVVSIGDLCGLINLNGDIIIPLGEYHDIRTLGRHSIESNVFVVVNGNDIFHLGVGKKLNLPAISTSSRFWWGKFEINGHSYDYIEQCLSDNHWIFSIVDENGKIQTYRDVEFVGYRRIIGNKIFNCFKKYVDKENDRCTLHFIEQNAVEVIKIEDWDAKSKCIENVDKAQIGIHCKTKYFDFRTLKCYFINKRSDIISFKSGDSKLLLSLSDIAVPINLNTDDIQAEIDRATDDLLKKHEIKVSDTQTVANNEKKSDNKTRSIGRALKDKETRQVFIYLFFVVIFFVLFALIVNQVMYLILG